MAKVHSPKTKAKARLLVEKGESVRDVAEVLGIDHKTVIAWSKMGGWVKGSIVPVLEQRERETALAVAEKAGLTRAKVAAKVVELMDAKKTVFHQGIPMAETTDNGTQGSAANLGADILGMKKADQESERTNDNLLSLIRTFKPTKEAK